MLYSENIFADLVCLERKRCERSGERFGLGLLTFPNSMDGIALSQALLTQLRSTDIIGWYRQNSVLGIIFTALNHTEPQLLSAMLHEKLDSALRAVLKNEDELKVLATIHIFPDNVGQEFYPDTFNSKQHAAFHILKRAIDVAISLTALILLFPFLLGIALLIKMSSPGPVLFRQTRLGFLGKPFDFLKFRTMYINNDPAIHKEYVTELIRGMKTTSMIYKIRNDPRITTIGHMLRKYSLDELPQFLNVLKGDMSVVGPRPPIPYEMASYRVWHMRRILEAKPGLTGLWQVEGRSRTTFDEMVRMDIRYIQHQCGWLDFKILLQTPRAVISGDGAY